MIAFAVACISLILLIALLGLIFKFVSLALKIILILAAIYLIYQLIIGRNKQ